MRPNSFRCSGPTFILQNLPKLTLLPCWKLLPPLVSEERVSSSTSTWNAFISLPQHWLPWRIFVAWRFRLVQHDLVRVGPSLSRYFPSRIPSVLAKWRFSRLESPFTWAHRSAGEENHPEQWYRSVMRSSASVSTSVRPHMC